MTPVPYYPGTEGHTTLCAKRNSWRSVTDLNNNFTKCATGEVSERFDRVTKAVHLFNDRPDIMFSEERIHAIKG